MMNLVPRTGVLVAVAAGSLALVGCSSPARSVPAVDLGRAVNLSAASEAAARFAVANGGIGVLEVSPGAGRQQVEDERRPREIDMRFVQAATVVTVDAPSTTSSPPATSTSSGSSPTWNCGSAASACPWPRPCPHPS